MLKCHTGHEKRYQRRFRLRCSKWRNCHIQRRGPPCICSMNCRICMCRWPPALPGEQAVVHTQKTVSSATLNLSAISEHASTARHRADWSEGPSTTTSSPGKTLTGGHLYIQARHWPDRGSLPSMNDNLPQLAHWFYTFNTSISFSVMYVNCAILSHTILNALHCALMGCQQLVAVKMIAFRKESLTWLVRK